MTKRKGRITMEILTEERALHTGEGPRRRDTYIWGTVLSAAAGFLVTGVSIGGALSPFGVSLVSALSPMGGLAALVGGAVSALAGKGLWKSAAELAAMTACVLFRFVLGRKFGSTANAGAAAAMYFISVCAFGGGGDWVLFAAAVIRGFLCFGAALCFSEAVGMMKHGFADSGRNREKADLQLASFGAVYVIMLAALCSYNVWIFNFGRIAAGVVCCAAARKFGIKGGAALGILSAAAFLMCESSLGRSGAMLAFAAMAAGHYQPRGKSPVNAAFIISAFGITAAAGMPSGTPQFIADTAAAAALYCLLPERLYLPKLNGICMAKDTHGSIYSDRLMFAEKILEDVGNDVEAAAGLLAKLGSGSRSGKDEEGSEITEAVRKNVCGSFCANRECTAAGLCGGSDVMENCFKAAQSMAQKEGPLTGKRLPSGFEGCSQRDSIAAAYNKALGIQRMQARKDADMRRLLENVTEQLWAACGMMGELSLSMEPERASDAALSEAAGAVLMEEGIEPETVSVTFDEEMHPFCEAYFYAEKRFNDVMLTEVTEKLGSLLGTALEKPVLISCGEGDKLLFRARWWGGTQYFADCFIDSIPAEGAVCGDTGTYFEDGLGNLYVILADGMGKGGRAAAESSMAVSILRRLVLAGAGTEGAVRILNVLLGAASSDETFTTADILKIDLFTGMAELIKMGAAPTLVYGKNEDGNFTHTRYDDCSAPLGILGKTAVTGQRFFADESSRIIMMTDGIGSEYEQYAKTVMENEKLTCEQMASRLADYADEDESRSEESLRRRDDKTAAAVRLYRADVRAM